MAKAKKAPGEKKPAAKAKKAPGEKKPAAKVKRDNDNQEPVQAWELGESIEHAPDESEDDEQ